MYVVRRELREIGEFGTHIPGLIRVKPFHMRKEQLCYVLRILFVTLGNMPRTVRNIQQPCIVMYPSCKYINVRDT